MAGVLADALCGRHGNWARQPQATANTRSHAASRLWAYSGPAPSSLRPERGRVRRSANWLHTNTAASADSGRWGFGDPAAYHRPVACPRNSACYETSAIITGLSLTCSYLMMGEEG